NEDEIDALTGATITTKAVLEAVNQAIAFAHSHLGLSQ
ncbi:MAG: FMN-binding protein, partial [Clostridia bacterium]|nr:FMN-binding protein [Clostridia bacterium]